MNEQHLASVVDRIVSRAKRRMIADRASNRIPRTRNYALLHDFVDANMYLLDDKGEFDADVMGLGIPASDEPVEVPSDAINVEELVAPYSQAQDILVQWVADGALLGDASGRAPAAPRGRGKPHRKARRKSNDLFSSRMLGGHGMNAGDTVWIKSVTGMPWAIEARYREGLGRFGAIVHGRSMRIDDRTLLPVRLRDQRIVYVPTDALARWDGMGEVQRMTATVLADKIEEHLAGGGSVSFMNGRPTFSGLPQRRKPNRGPMPQGGELPASTSPQTGLSYRVIPTGSGTRVEVLWAGAYRGIRGAGRSVFDRLARRQDEAIFSSDAAASAAVREFESAFVRELEQKYNGRGRSVGARKETLGWQAGVQDDARNHEIVRTPPQR